MTNKEKYLKYYEFYKRIIIALGYYNSDDWPEVIGEDPTIAPLQSNTAEVFGEEAYFKQLRRVIDGTVSAVDKDEAVQYVNRLIISVAYLKPLLGYDISIGNEALESAKELDKYSHKKYKALMPDLIDENIGFMERICRAGGVDIIDTKKMQFKKVKDLSLKSLFSMDFMEAVNTNPKNEYLPLVDNFEKLLTLWSSFSNKKDITISQVMLDENCRSEYVKLINSKMQNVHNEIEKLAKTTDYELTSMTMSLLKNMIDHLETMEKNIVVQESTRVLNKANTNIEKIKNKDCNVVKYNNPLDRIMTNSFSKILNCIIQTTDEYEFTIQDTNQYIAIFEKEYVPKIMYMHLLNYIYSQYYPGEKDRPQNEQKFYNDVQNHLQVLKNEIRKESKESKEMDVYLEVDFEVCLRFIGEYYGIKDKKNMVKYQTCYGKTNPELVYEESDMLFFCEGDYTLYSPVNHRMILDLVTNKLIVKKI